MKVKTKPTENQHELISSANACKGYVDWSGAECVKISRNVILISLVDPDNKIATMV